MKKIVEVTQYIEVEVDEAKFDEEFLEDFRGYMYNFKDIDDHIKHLAQLYARGIANNHSFIEGYGEAKDMGIKFKEDCDADIAIIGE